MITKGNKKRALKNEIVSTGINYKLISLDYLSKVPAGL